MVIAEWHEEYCTGHALIDDQHRNLFSLVNQIHAMIDSPTMDQYRVGELLQVFAKSATEHFDLEEDLMTTYEYPNIAAHQNTHARLLGKVNKVLEQMATTHQIDIESVTPVLADWMIHHIRGEDQRMIQFFQSQPLPVGCSAGQYMNA